MPFLPGSKKIHTGSKKIRPTVDQAIAELEKLQAKARELEASGGSRFSLNHSMRLWCDGARHALTWSTGVPLDAGGFAKGSRPSVALEMLVLALRPRKLSRTIGAPFQAIAPQDVGGENAKRSPRRRTARSLNKPGGIR